MIGGHDNLQSYYQSNFNLMYFFKWSLGDLEELMPWERDVYISMLAQQKEKEKNKNG